MKIKSWLIDKNIQIHQVYSGFYNSFLVCVNNNCVLIDTGREAGYKRLYQNIIKKINTSSQLKALILTHTHFDHCENAFRLKKDFGVKVIVSTFEANYLSSGYCPLPKGTNKISDFLSGFGHRILKNYFSYQPVKADILISGKQNLNKLGFPELEIFPTPGHTKGSISVIVNKKIAIVGDALLRIIQNSTFPPYADDVPELIKSWKVLLNTDCTMFLPGHGFEISKDELAKNYKKYTIKYGLHII
ncbi:MAG: MBL fold metallo-hydrolase [Chlorobi bacterium]|nr:MBL fold metallo-hydrolase [Chlorobiota bacterium]